jgi:ADP-ribose pyrophosphatase
MNIQRPQSAQPLPVSAKKVFSGVVFDVYQWEQEQFNGTTKTFEKLKRPDTVLIIPIMEDGSVVFSEEEQPGKQPFFGFLGGRVEDGESPEEAVRRELLEESGMVSDYLELIEAMQPASKIDWAVYTFVARNCRTVAGQSLDSGERIKLLHKGFDEAVATIAEDTFDDGIGKLSRMAIKAQYDENIKLEIRRLLYGR